MTLQEKIAKTPKLERIDSSIESCIKILREELIKRTSEHPRKAGFTYRMHYLLEELENDFNEMKGKK